MTDPHQPGTPSGTDPADIYPTLARKPDAAKAADGWKVKRVLVGSLVTSDRVMPAGLVTVTAEATVYSFMASLNWTSAAIAESGS